jgi:hypothetical protein
MLGMDPPQIVGRRFCENMIIDAIEIVESRAGAPNKILWQQMGA